MKTKSIIITLRDEPKIFTSNEDLLMKGFTINNLNISEPRFPPWSSFCDILYDSKSRYFVGVTFEVFGKRFVKQLSTYLNRNVAVYNDHKLNSTKIKYPEKLKRIDWLEICWSNVKPDSCEQAQIETVYCYYEGKVPTKWSLSRLQASHYKNIYAFGLTSIDSILDEFDLVFPPELCFPRFEPTFLNIEK